MPQANENVFSVSSVDEQLLAGQWREQKKKVEDKQQAKNSRNKLDTAREFGEEFLKIMANPEIEGTKLAIKLGLEVGERIKEEIKEKNFVGLWFYSVLILCLIKDLVDFATLGIFGVIINFFISVTLYSIFFLRKSRFKRWIIKTFLWRAIPTTIIEFIPFLAIFPAWTVGAILLKLKMDKEVKKLNLELEDVEQEIEKIKYRRY